MPCCRCSPPEFTNCIEIPAREVREGDQIDTMRESGFGVRDRGIHLVTRDAITEDGTTRIHREGETSLWCKPSTLVSVWRTAADARPIDLRHDRPLRNLTDVHRAGEEGLSALFPIGTVWEVGPFVEGCDPTVVRIIGKPYSDGINYSCRPEDAEAKGKAVWYVPTETLSPPLVGRRGGQPPHVLCALTPRMARKAGVVNASGHCCGLEHVERERDMWKARAIAFEGQIRCAKEALR